MSLPVQDTSSIVTNFRLQNGQCASCGTSCYDVKTDPVSRQPKLVPLTVPEVVLQGRCLYCHPQRPRESLCRSNPRTATPSPAAATLPVPAAAVSSPVGIATAGGGGDGGSDGGRADIAVSPPAGDQEARRVSDAGSTASQPSSRVSNNNQRINSSESETGEDVGRISTQASSVVLPPQKRKQDSNQSSQKINNKKHKPKRSSSESESSSENSRRIITPRFRKISDDDEVLASANISNQDVIIRDYEERVFRGTLSEGTVKKGKGRFEHRHPDDDEDCAGKISIYDGQIVNGKMEGKGKLVDARASVYEGEFKEGCPQGKGCVVWKGDGIEWKYEGGIVGDKMAGKGKKFQLRVPDGEIYEGEFKNDKFNGEGVLKFEGGGKVKGTFRNGKLNGHAKYEFSNGSIYVGNFKDDLRSGEGTMTYAEDGAEYDGEWLDNVRHGRGKLKFANGDEYNGNFLRDFMNGDGKMVYADGTVYGGNFKDDRRHGRGRAAYANGQRYEGEWRNDKRYNGTLYNVDLSDYKGSFKDDEFYYGTLTRLDGTKVKYKNGRVTK